MQLNLQGKTAIVTGASKGIGRAIAEILAEEGCHLHLAARTEAALATAREAIRSKHQVSVTIHALDLSNPASAQQLIAAAPKADILVNNAGAIPAGDLLSLSEATMRTAWDLKVFGYMNMCREMYREMKGRNQGVIINVIGTGGERPTAGYIAGGAGNASLIAFTRALGASSANDGIRVVGVNPGMIQTDRLDFLAQGLVGGKDTEAWQKILAGLPFGRPGRVEEVADMVAFLASSRASYISGTVITIDAGAAARG